MSHTSETLQAAFKYLFPDEVPALKQLAQSLPDKPVVVNLGAGAGTSGLAFMESRNDLFLYTVDIQKDNSPLGCLYAEEQVLRAAGLWGWSEKNLQIRGLSIRVGQLWEKNPLLHLFGQHHKVDLVFIDGDHSYEGCKGDILAWLPNIKPGGILAIHDYKKGELFESETDYQLDKPHPKILLGVDKAVDELLLDKFELILRVESLVAFRV